MLGRAVFCMWVFDLSDSCGGTHSQTKLRVAHMCGLKGCTQRWGLAYMQFPPLLICLLSASKIYLSWEGRMVHLADAFQGRSPSLGPGSAVSGHCHLWQIPGRLWVSVASSPESKGFKYEI